MIRAAGIMYQTLQGRVLSGWERVMQKYDAFEAGFAMAITICAEATEQERLRQAAHTNTERLIGIQFAQQAVSKALRAFQESKGKL